MAKTTCTVSRTYFNENAKPLIVEIKDHDGNVVFKGYMAPRQFDTGSMGWNISAKANILVGPIDCPTAQIGMNVTLVGSKDMPKIDPKPTAPVVAPKAPAVSADMSKDAALAPLLSAPKPSIVELAKKVA